MSFFYTVFKGDDIFAQNGSRVQRLVPSPGDGLIMVTDSTSESGFRAYTAAQLINSAGIGDLSMLQTKGDIPVYNGTSTVALSTGLDGYVLAANSSTPTGVEWVPADAAGGSVDPTPDTLVIRSSTGQIKAYGFETSHHVVPSTTGITVGTSSSPFFAAHALTMNTPTIQSAAALGISSANSFNIVLSVGSSAKMTILPSRVDVVNPLVAQDSVVIGTFGASGSYQLKAEGGALVIKKWNGTSYANYSVLA